MRPMVQRAGPARCRATAATRTAAFAALRVMAVCGVIAAVTYAAPAHADSCAKSRDLILSSGDLPQKPKTYQDLYKMCLDTLRLSNVKDAFILRAAAIAVIPKTDSVAATASTLGQFCTRYPRGMLHFVGRQELRQAASTAQAIRISPGASTPCQKITGSG